MRWFWLIALGVLLAPSAQAQYGSVDGQIVDQDGQPVEGAPTTGTPPMAEPRRLLLDDEA